MWARLLSILLALLSLFACGGPRTEEERVVAVVRSWAEAVEAGRFDDAWERLDPGRRNLLAEMRDAMLAGGGRFAPDLEQVRGLLAEGESIEALAGADAAEFHRNLGERGGLDSPDGLLAEPRSVRVTGEFAAVAYPQRRVHLRKRKGCWGIEAVVPADWPEPGLWRGEADSGREIVYAVVTELTRKELPVLLPRLPGAGEVILDEYGYRLSLDETGTFHHFAEPLTAAGLREELAKSADRKRDQDRWDSPSLIWLVLRADRAAPWGAVRQLFTSAVAKECRLRRLLLVSDPPQKLDDLGLPVALSVAFPTIDLVPGPGMTVEVRGGTTFAGLPEAIRARPPWARRLGVEVRIGAGVPAEAALRALIAIGSAGPGRIVLGGTDVAPGGAAVTLDGQPVEIREGEPDPSLGPGETLPLLQLVAAWWAPPDAPPVRELPGLAIWDHGPWRRLLPGRSTRAEVEAVRDEVARTLRRGWFDDSPFGTSLFGGCPPRAWTAVFDLREGEPGGPEILDGIRFHAELPPSFDGYEYGLAPREVIGADGGFTEWLGVPGITWTTTLGGQFVTAPRGSFRSVEFHEPWDGVATPPDRAEPAEVDLELPEVYADRATVLRRVRNLVARGEFSSPRIGAAGLLELHHDLTGLDFVLVPGGTFAMGGAGEDALSIEKPVREVSVAPFLVAKTECTQEAWDSIWGRFAESAPARDRRSAKGANLPIDGVTFANARRWCRLTGLELPSEAQWEYAARAGARTAWHHGDDRARLPDFAWCGRNSGRRIHPVATRAPNAFGLLDTAGNVDEWCVDRFIESYEDAPAEERPRLGKPTLGGERVVRGGSAVSASSDCRCAARRGMNAYRTDDRGPTGFRPTLRLRFGD